MPHECTTCSRVFADGSKEMLSGCPDCGGNKFQFRPAGSDGDGGSSGDAAAAASGAASRADDAPPDPPEPPTPGGTVAETVAGATERVRNLVGSDDTGTDDTGGSVDGSRVDESGTDEEPRTGDRSSDPDGSSTDDRTWPSVGQEPEQEPRAAQSDPKRREHAADATDAQSGAAGVPTTDEDTAQASARSSVVERDELPDPPEPEERSDGIDEDRDGVPANGRDGAPADGRDRGSSDGRDGASAADGRSPPAADSGVTDGSSSADASSSTPAPDDAPSAKAAGSDAESEPGSAPFTGNGDRESPDLSDLREELNDQFESIRIVERGQYELNLMELYDREEYIVSLMEDGRYAIEVPETWRDD